jgi:hypothetical protein
MHPKHQRAETEFWTKVTAHIAKLRAAKDLTPLTVIEPGSAEWGAWDRYFRDYLGFESLAMKRVRWGQSKWGSVTVPTQWPEWFDSEYAAQQAAA